MAKRDLDLERKWKIKFDEYKKSGQSVKGWCKNNGIIHTTFRYWIKRFTQSEEFPSVDTQFAKVPGDFSPEALIGLMKVLKTL